MEGAAWQEEKLLELNPEPNPTPASPGRVPETESTSWNRSFAELKKFTSSEFKPARGPPAPAGPPRTPGSCWANAVPARSSIPRARDKTDASLAVFIQKSPHPLTNSANPLGYGFPTEFYAPNPSKMYPGSLL